MLGVDKILVAINRNDSAAMVLDKACTLANAAGASLEVVHVAYDSIAELPVQEIEKNQVLKTFILEASETWLEDQLDAIRHRFGAAGRGAAGRGGAARGAAGGAGADQNTDTAPSPSPTLESMTLWNKKEWQGIIHAAELGRADLIIKAADPSQRGMSVRTPQDYNLLRHAEVPVMLVKAHAWVEDPVIMAAVDVLDEEQADLSRRILTEADSLAAILGGELALVTAYPIMEPWAGSTAVGVDFQQLHADLERITRRAIDKLATDAGVSFNYLYIEEGRPATRIRHLTEETHTEVLVMGTAGRSGIKSLVIGNTSEMILHNTHCDVVVLR